LIQVITNAIRTSGHLFNLLKDRTCIFDANLDDNVAWTRLCTNFLHVLGQKIDQAILDKVTTTSEDRSWQQRSNTKKQAWGACQTLSPILQYTATSGDIDRDAVRQAIVHLIHCIEYSHKINEKITVGATTSLCAISVDTWSSFSGREGIRGLCLAACLTKVKLVSLPSGVKDQLYTIMDNLLRCVSDHDILTCLGHKGVSQENIQYLYGWMVDRNLGSIPFESFGRVLSYPSLQSDISLIQRFQSRATYEERKRRQSGGDLSELLLDDDSDEDEL